jgi:hypothetical protein
MLSQTDIQKKIQSRQACLKIEDLAFIFRAQTSDKAAVELNLQPRCCIGTIVLLAQYFVSEVSRIETELKSLFSLLGLFRN